VARHAAARRDFMTTCTFTRSTATIAAWNLAGFGGIPQARLREQVEGLSLLDAEVVTLVEIPSEDALNFLRDELAHEADLEYQTLFLPQQSDLHIGLLFKTGVTVENEFLLDGSDLGDPANRKALVAEVKVGKFDFTLIAVHLKSGREKANQDIRDQQCQVIGEFIATLRGPQDRNPDILLMGDFNMIPGQDISNFHHLGGDDVMDFVSSWDLQERYSHVLEAGRANLLDGFAISKKFSTEYIRGSLRLFPMHWSMDIGRERFREKVSDHLPFVATFRIDRDRD
jgi:endonuclease/exonuclease/phosphatase family metal-dependent hydrolase